MVMANIKADKSRVEVYIFVSINIPYDAPFSRLDYKRVKPHI
jgi:hypothetical protein